MTAIVVLRGENHILAEKKRQRKRIVGKQKMRLCAVLWLLRISRIEGIHRKHSVNWHGGARTRRGLHIGEKA